MKYDITLQYTPEFLRGIPPGGLQELLVDAQRRRYELNAQVNRVGRRKLPECPDLFGKARKDIARIKTIIRESIQLLKGETK